MSLPPEDEAVIAQALADLSPPTKEIVVAKMRKALQSSWVGRPDPARTREELEAEFDRVSEEMIVLAVQLHPELLVTK